MAKKGCTLQYGTYHGSSGHVYDGVKYIPVVAEGWKLEHKQSARGGDRGI